MLKMTLKLHDGVKRDGTSRAITPNKVVFTQNVESDDPFATKLIESLYIDKRDVKAFGLTTETPNLEVTFKAVA